MVWLVLAGALLADTDVTPRLVRGGVPEFPSQALGGGQVLLELELGPRGTVSHVHVLRDHPPFTSALADAARDWTFSGPGTPAGRVLVAGVFRPPAVVGGGVAAGEPARDVGSASEGVPFPMQIAAPAFPPHALGDGVVLLEVEVGVDGRVSRTRVVQSAPPFDAPALEAIQRWRFRPAHAEGHPAGAAAYVVFGFRQPVTSPPPRK